MLPPQQNYMSTGMHNMSIIGLTDVFCCFRQTPSPLSAVLAVVCREVFRAGATPHLSIDYAFLLLPSSCLLYMRLWDVCSCCRTSRTFASMSCWIPFDSGLVLYLAPALQSAAGWQGSCMSSGKHCCAPSMFYQHWPSILSGSPLQLISCCSLAAHAASQGPALLCWMHSASFARAGLALPEGGALA